MSEVIIIGAGGHGKVIADIIEKNGDKVAGFLDDDLSKEGVMGPVSDCLKNPDKKFIIAIGNNKIRKRIVEEYPQIDYYTAIHPTAVIAPDAEIGKGSAVMALSVINATAKIGNHCIINTGAVVEHDNALADYVHISPRAALCGTVSVGECTQIGAGAVVRNNLTIAGDCIIGIGAAVSRVIVKSGVYVGDPAKPL